MPEKIKKKRTRRNKEELFEILETYGVKSQEFYNYIEPFLIKTIHKFTYADFDESLINDCYVAIVKAYCGYYKVVKGDKVFVPPYFSREKCSHPINFLITLCRNQVTLYDYHRNKQQLELERNTTLDNISDTDSLDNRNYSVYTFNKFLFNDSFNKYIHETLKLKPTNNILYNYLQWENSSNT